MHFGITEKMHYRVKNWGKIGEGVIGVDPKESVLTFLAQLLCKISSKSNKNWDHRSTDRQTDGHK